MRIVTALGFASVLAGACAAPEVPPQLLVDTAPAAQLQAGLERTATAINAGVVLDVQACGLNFTEAAGVANRKTGAPMPTDEPLRIASIGKLYTAAIIHMLADEGLVALDKSAGDYLGGERLSGIPNADASLRELLNHTSGVPDYYDARSYVMWDWKKPITTERVFRVAARKSATHPVGEAYAYSNTNYHILALVAEHVTGETLSALMEERLFTPLSLNDTRYNTAHPGGTIHGYGTELRANADTWVYAENTGPDSGITATPADLRRYLRAMFLEDGALADTGKLMVRDPVETGKARQLAGPGAEIFVSRSGRKLVGHTGDTYGYLTFAFAIPEYDATIIGHMNANRIESFNALLKTTANAVMAQCESAPAGDAS